MSNTPARKPVEPLGYRVADFCKATNTSHGKAYEMMRSGELRYVILAGRRFIPNSEVARLLENWGPTVSQIDNWEPANRPTTWDRANAVVEGDNWESVGDAAQRVIRKLE
jgi:hypothetical protein